MLRLLVVRVLLEVCLALCLCALVASAGHATTKCAPVCQWLKINVLRRRMCSAGVPRVYNGGAVEAAPVI